MKFAMRRREQGQTIIVALIILGLLLILGFVFLGIVNRGVQGSARAQTRTIANDLAEAGIRYARTQLLRSVEGADWRGEPTPVTPTAADPNRTQDPDGIYLRPASGFLLPNGQLDQGGPDGLGNFIRVGTDNGRFLVRVRYAPSDANIFATATTGALRDPGAVRNYLIIESIGRRGRITGNDPTQLLSGPSIQFRNFASQADFTTALAQFQAAQVTANDRRLTAFMSIGLTDTARFITNLFKVSRPAEIGIPSDLGAAYAYDNPAAPTPVGPNIAMQLGLPSVEGATAASPLFNIGGLGSLHSNADLTVYGRLNVFANRSLGDQITVAGNISSQDNARLNVNAFSFNRASGTWNSQFNLDPVNGGVLNSRNNVFSTLGGIIRDGVAQPDADGISRGVGYKEPPRISEADPETGELRYLQLTRESGNSVAGGNSGRFGFGEGVYVDNSADLQSPPSEGARQANPGSSSAVSDWLNPARPDSRYWLGAYYIPPGSSLELRSDGFVIARDARSDPNQRFWRLPDGSPTALTTIRFRIGRGPDAGDRRMRVVNSLTPGIANIDGALTPADYLQGPVFNGVLYFEGNVRVRGVVPTDAQITVVTNGIAYLEGSITKGTVGNAFTATYRTEAPFNDPEAPTAVGVTLNRPSRSAIAILAREHVALNTTMLFGPSPNQALDPGRDGSSVRVRQDQSLSLQAEFVSGAPNAASTYNPSAWVPFATNYRDAITNSVLNVRTLVSHTSEDGGADRSFIAMNVNPLRFDSPTVVSPYFFPNVAPNAAAPVLGSPNPTIPAYGLGIENYQRFPSYENLGFVLVDPANSTVGSNLITATGITGEYRLALESSNQFTITPNPISGQPTNDYLLQRFALTPHDIRIEAMLYAEQGSFYVIPGVWQNPNVNDRRDIYLARVNELIAAGNSAADARAIADDERRTQFGSSPEYPFYGEPLAVRVLINGSISENMPPSMGEQAEWLRKWGWMPRELGATQSNIPSVHVAAGYDLNTLPVVPNLIVAYDPVLGSGRADGFRNLDDPSRVLRRDRFGRVLPPLPRLPVSPSFAYFGDLN